MLDSFRWLGYLLSLVQACVLSYSNFFQQSRTPKKRFNLFFFFSFLICMRQRKYVKYLFS